MYDSKQICETLNNHFSDIGPRMAQNTHPPSNTCKFTNLSLVNNNLTSFYVNPISANEVLNHLNELKLSKSVGSNGILIRYIIMASCIIAPTLTKLYNYCIEEGTFPDILKIAEVRPIYKKDRKDICENYRPISLLSRFSKIFEKCIHYRLTQYLKKRSYLMLISMDLDPTVLHLMLSLKFVMIVLIILTKDIRLVVCF